LGDMTMRRAGYAPLESAGEYVCECLRDGDRVFPEWGNEVCERIVRCRDCKFCMSYWGADYCDFFSHVTNDPDGFCSWGCRKQ